MIACGFSTTVTAPALAGPPVGRSQGAGTSAPGQSAGLRTPLPEAAPAVPVILPTGSSDVDLPGFWFRVGRQTASSSRLTSTTRAVMSHSTATVIR